MPEPVRVGGLDIAEVLDADSLREWIQPQRWYASKSRSIAGTEIVESVVLDEEPLLLLTLVQTRFATGTPELYQLPVVPRPAARVVLRPMPRVVLRPVRRVGLGRRPGVGLGSRRGVRRGLTAGGRELQG